MKSYKSNNARGAVKLIAASILLGSCLTVHATTLNYSTSWSTYDFVNSGANVDNQYDYLNNSGDKYIPQFDPTLGTLQSIDLVFSGMSLRSYAYANFRDDDWLSAVDGYQRLNNMGVTFAMPGYGFSRYVSQRVDTCSDTGGVTSGASCNTLISDYTQGLASLSVTLSNPSALTAYIGTGGTLISIDQTGVLYTDETDGDDGYINNRYGRISASGSIYITYNYSPVPVPAAAWLFGSGLLGLIGLSRRRKAG